MQETKAVRVRVSGQVQGVFFRVWSRDKAQQLGIVGWVRNRLDGDVEALLVGTEEAVDELIEAFQAGPASAVVDEVKVEPAQGITPETFLIKPTV